MDFSSFGGGGGAGGPGPSSSASAGGNKFGSDNASLLAILAVSLVVVFGLVLALKR